MPHQHFYFINQSAAVLTKMATGKGRGVGRTHGFVLQACTGEHSSAGEDGAAGNAPPCPPAFPSCLDELLLRAGEP